MEDKQDNHMDIFKESIERGLAALKRLENNDAFVMYHLEQAKEAFEGFYEHTFSILNKKDDLSIELIVKLKEKDEKHVIIRVSFDEDAIDSFHSDFKQAEYNAKREDLVDYINNVLKDNNKMYWALG